MAMAHCWAGLYQPEMRITSLYIHYIIVYKCFIFLIPANSDGVFYSHS